MEALPELGLAIGICCPNRNSTLDWQVSVGSKTTDFVTHYLFLIKIIKVRRSIY